MSSLIAAPELITTAATDLANIGSAVVQSFSADRFAPDAHRHTGHQLDHLVAILSYQAGVFVE